MEYQKINTLFKRDANNIIIPSQFTFYITKIKTCDFEKYKAKYGDAICLNQPVNPKHND